MKLLLCWFIGKPCWQNTDESKVLYTSVTSAFFPLVYQHYEGFVLFRFNATVVVYGSPSDITMTYV